MPTIRLSPWERYMTLDHGRNHSMTCHSRYWFKGEVDQEKMEAAILHVAKFHPLLAARLSGNAWQPVVFNSQQQIFWNDNPNLIEWTHLSSDDFLVRFFFHSGTMEELGLHDPECANQTGFLLVVKYPHAITDGLGIHAFLLHLKLHLEGELISENAISDIGFRQHLGFSLWGRFRRIGWDVYRNWTYFFRKPATWAIGSETNDCAQSPTITFERMALSGEFTEQIRQRSRAAGCRVNDILLAAYFRVLSQAISSEQFIRIGVPVSQRPPAREELCNLVSMVFLDRRPHGIASQTLLDSISHEMKIVKNKRLGFSMIAFLNLACVWQGRFLRSFLNTENTQTTSVLTNLGRPFSDPEGFQLMDASLAGVDSIVPIRPGTNLGLSVSELSGKLSFTLRYNESVCSSAEAQKFLENFRFECLRGT